VKGDNTLISTDLYDQLKSKVVDMCVEIQIGVKTMAEEFFQEQQRRYYTTPTLYLEVVNLCILLLRCFKTHNSYLFFSVHLRLLPLTVY
jgi:P-loop containing dynein motor region D4